jgi:hypothetical protein
VFVYRHFSPFDFAGVSLGGWSIAIDIHKRSSPEVEGSHQRSAKELEEELKSILNEQFSVDLQQRELLLLHGSDANILPRRVAQSLSIRRRGPRLEMDERRRVIRRWPKTDPCDWFRKVRERS